MLTYVEHCTRMTAQRLKAAGGAAFASGWQRERNRGSASGGDSIAGAILFCDRAGQPGGCSAQGAHALPGPLRAAWLATAPYPYPL